MKKTKILLGVAAFAGITFSSCQGDKTTSVKLTNEKDSVSYALGMNAGISFSQNLDEFPGGVNKDALIAGFVQTLKADSASYQITQDEIYPIIENFFSKEANKEKEKAQVENDKILSENKTKEGVKATESGLQYRIITEGTGAIPTKDDVVRVHYTGRLYDGTVFDSSVERGTPAEFPLMGVIPGWTEALQLMPVGSKWELAIPSELGYGDRSIGNIPANSVLFFEVELLDIIKK